MKRNLSLATTALALTAALAAIPAFSQSQLPAEQSQGAVRYISGGIGLDESEAIKRAASKYPLALEFYMTATPRNEYLSDVSVVVKDRAGKTVLDTVSGGPFLLASLATGTYSVTATTKEGNAQRRSVEVKSGGHQRLVFTWKS